MHSRSLALLALIAFAFSLPGALAQEKPGELELVLERAAQYVAQYEDHQLGNLLVNENYLQKATVFAPNGVSVLSKPQRRLQSDFLILQVGSDRIGVRKVNQVDGFAVKSTEGSLENLMNDSPDAIRKVRVALRDENVRYDIGGVLRENNAPTFALKVLRKSEAPRFKFEKGGTDKIAGLQTLKVKFQEKVPPTLLHGNGGEALFSSGFLWIEPITGRVLKTEFVMENPYPNQKARGQAIVTYSEEKKLGMFVPSLMIEHYETSGSYVDTRAEYSNFRSFKVDVKAEIVP